MKAVKDLSRRERQVISLIARGRSNQEIAQSLKITLSTVNNHVARVRKVLGVRTRIHIALYAFKVGLVHLRDIELPGQSKKSEVAQ